MDVSSCELVEQLLKNTGLSCDDLLLKLQAYRCIQTKSDGQENADDSSHSLASNSVPKDETKQDVSSNENSVILETKSSEVDNRNSVESQTQCVVNQDRRKSDDEQCHVQTIDDDSLKCTTEKSSCQKIDVEDADICSDKAQLVVAAPVSDVTIEKISAEKQEAAASKTKVITSSAAANSQSLLEERDKKDCNTLNNDSQLPNEVQAQEGSEETQKVNITFTCEATTEQKAAKEGPRICEEAECSKLSSEIHERNSSDCETERENSCDVWEEIHITVSCESQPEKDGYNIGDCKRDNESKPSPSSEENSSSVSSRNQKEHSAFPVCGNIETGEDISKIIKDSSETESGKSKKPVVPDDSDNCQVTLEKQKTQEDSTVLCEANRSELSSKRENKDTCERRNKHRYQITKSLLERITTWQNTKDQEEDVRISNESETLVETSQATFEPKDNTSDIIDKSSSKSCNNVGNIDHDYSNTGSNTKLLPETKERSSSDSETEREYENLPKSEENLRDVLRMQLSSLRNKKKSTGFLPTLKKTMFFQNLKKKRKSCDVNPLMGVNEDDEKEKNDEETKENDENEYNSSTNENSLLSLPDDASFVSTGLSPTSRKNIFFQSLKRKRKSFDINPDEKESNDEESKEKEGDNGDGVSTNENSVMSISDEAAFAIVNDTRGVERLSPIDLEGNEESMFAYATRNESEETVPNPGCSTSQGTDSSKIEETSNGSDNNTFDSVVTSENKTSPQITVRRNISESFIRDPGINRSVKNSEKSPFVSDSLDDFLNESAELKVSYPIPKLGAEEGITENTKTCLFTKVVESQTSKTEQENPQREPKLIKAKTLAEMRRHFEKLKAKENKQVTDQAPPLKGKRSYRRKFLNINKAETEERPTTGVINVPNISDENALPRNSYIIYNNKKIWMPCKVKDKCLGNFQPKTNRSPLRKKTTVLCSAKPEPITNKKPSLLSSLMKKPCSIKYKPGPLSKKVLLQNEESKSHWTTELKTLPKIYLEVVPEVEKPLHPSIVHLLPVFDQPVVTEERVNFALSALKVKDVTPTQATFKFHIPFNNNQEKILVRKPFKRDAVTNEICDSKETDPENEISQVISDLITYVETKELGDSIIKEDDSVIKPETSGETLKTRARKIKRSKIDRELFRLSCKVIDVATNKENTDCVKPHCRLGCVCKSLLCDSVFSNHCQLVECMFGCTCPTDASSSRITSKNSLSAHTVNHLEDKAKKNLAKVEKEFTQTFIHTDDDAILVGTAKERRSCKPPKKYTDFVGDDVFDSPPLTMSERESLKCKGFDLVLDNLPLQDVIPFCLVHAVYDCPCKGECDVVPTKKTEGDQIPKIRIVKSKEDQHKAWYESCARIRRVFPEYKERNKTALYKRKLRRGQLGRKGPRKKQYKQQKQEEFIEQEDERTTDVFDIQLDVLTNEKPKMDKKPSKRKQCFEVREDVVLPCVSAASKRKLSVDDWEVIVQPSASVPVGKRRLSSENREDVYHPRTSTLAADKGKQSTNLVDDILLPYIPTTEKRDKEFALQRRKKKVKANPPNVVAVDNSIYKPIFDGEIKVSLKENKEMLGIIGSKNSSLEYLRILPWRKLMHSFLSGKMSIWAKNSPSSPLLCNSAGYFPPKNFVPITKLTERCEIVDWILNDYLPPDRPRDLMHLILTPRGMHFLIAGYCLKKISKGATPLEAKDDFLNKRLTPTPEVSNSSFADVADVDVEIEENSDEGSSSKINDGVNSNQQSLLRCNKLEDAPALTPPDLEMSVATNSEDLELLKSELLKRPNKIEVLDGTTLKPIARKNVVKKSLLLVPRKGIASRRNTTKITTKRTYVKVGSVFGALHSMANNSELNSTSPPTIKQVLNAPDPLGDARIISQLLKTSETEEDSSALVATLNTLLESSDRKRKEFELGKKNVTPLGRKSPTTSSRLVDKQSTRRDLLKTVSSSASKKRPEDPLETAVTNRSASRRTTEEQQQPSAKKSKRDPLALTEDDLSISQKETSSSFDYIDDVPLVKRTRTSRENVNKSKKNITSQSGVIPSRSLKCTHRDMNNENKTLVLTNKMFPQRKIFYTENDIKCQEMSVALPPVAKSCKWRMIYLNSDFAYLTFVIGNYSIKYTDLKDVVKMSGNIKSTITLRNKEFCDAFKHPLFGIYCVPDYQDRLFVGPYVPTEKHCTETFRYLQGRLIDTQIFNKMTGKACEKKPLWLFETPPRPLSLPKGLVIDITEDEASEIAVVNLDSDSSEETENTSKLEEQLENSLLFPPFVEELTQEELKSRHSINRYITTNIPHLGYFDARQCDSAIEVFWPDGKKGYRFPNVTLAKNLLTRYLSQIFCSIPQDFKINVVIMTKRTQINKPIDPKYLSGTGPYFCGDFGIYEKDAIPGSLLEIHNVPSIESLLISHKKVQEDEHAMIRIFGLFLMSNEELRKHSEPYKILQWAISEMYILKKLAENYESEKADLQRLIANKQNIIEKHKERKNQETIEDSATVSETIEIEDSDEESQFSADIAGPTFRRISTSGRIETDQFKTRSLLKSNLWIKPGRSILKNKDTSEQSASAEPVQISLKNSNIVLKQNNFLITKLN